MELKDIYLDKNVNGYVVFKTLSRKSVMETIERLYHGELSISRDDLIQNGDCLIMPFHHQDFEKYIEFYKSIMRISDNQIGEIVNEFMGTTLRTSMNSVFMNRLDSVMIGMTEWFQAFLIRFNIRGQHLVLDIYFSNGQSYYLDDSQLYVLEDNHYYQKYIKKYNLEDRNNE